MSTNRREKVEHWLIKNQKYINYQAIEREIGVAKGCIQKFLKYNRKINDDRIAAIEQWIKQLNINSF
ncbi:hypothetical protein [Aquimarina rhabdastrellae]